MTSRGAKSREGHSVTHFQAAKGKRKPKAMDNFRRSKMANMHAYNYM